VVHGHYLIFYRITTDAVEIIHVLHGARDFESVLFPETKEPNAGSEMMRLESKKNGGPAIADPSS
jgi:hypothetical protein